MVSGGQGSRLTERAGDRLPAAIRLALARFRSRVRLVRAAAGLGYSLALLALLFLLALAFDRALLLPPAARMALTAGTLGIAGLAALVSLAAALLRPLPPRRLARGLEAAIPSLDEALITTLELAEDGPPPGSSEPLVEALAGATAKRVSGLRLGRVVDGRRARRGLLAAATALLGLLLYGGSEPRGFAQMANRFFHPREELPRPSRVGLVVLPGNAVVGVEDDFTVLAQVTRGSPSAVRLRSRVLGGEWRTVLLQPSAGPSHYGHEFHRLHQTFEYQVLAGDARSPIHQVEVRERPRAESFTVTYRFPSYTGLPPATRTSPRGDLSAVAGTVAELSVISSGRPVAARIVGVEEPGGGPLAVTSLDGGRAEVKARLELRRSGSYRLHLEDASGVSNRGGDLYPIQAEPDHPPRARITSPRTAEVVVEEARRLEIQYQVEDDFGVSELALLAGAGGERAGAGAVPAASAGRTFPIALPGGEPKNRSAVTGSYRWDLALLGLRPGESLPFRLAARDGAGQTGLSEEMVLRVAFLPDPPEGADWLPGLRELKRALERLSADWNGLLGPPSERSATFAVDPARAERTGKASEETLRQLSRLRQLGDLSAALGRRIPIPSRNRPAMVHLGAGLKRLAEKEGKELWVEALALTGKIREKLAPKKEPPPAGSAPEEVSAERLQAAHDAASARLGELLAAFQAIERAERLKSALERARGLLAAEEEMVERARDLGARPPPASGEEPDPWQAAASLEKGLQIEATALGADLLQLAKGEEGPLKHLAATFLESVVPALDSAQAALSARSGAGLPATLEAACRGFREVGEGLEVELLRAEESAGGARAALRPSLDIPGRLTRLGASENEAASALSREGTTGLSLVAAGDLARRSEAALLRVDLEAAADEAEKAQPQDFESAGDLLALRDIFRDLAETTLAALERRSEEIQRPPRGSSAGGKRPEEELKQLIAERGRAGQLLLGMARAQAGVEPGVRLGTWARELEAVAEAEETLSWRLRGSPTGPSRTLRALARIQAELAGTLSDVRSGLEGFQSGLAAGSPPLAHLTSALSELAAASGSAKEAEARCLSGDAPGALSLSSETARRASGAARALDEARSALPDLARARGWILHQMGSLPQRAERLAREEEAHADGLRRLAGQLGGATAAAEPSAQPGAGGPLAGSIPPLEEEQVAAVGLEEENLRQEAERLAGSVAREAARLSQAPLPGRKGAGAGSAEAIRQLDVVADRILTVSRGGMLRASRAIGSAATAAGPAPQRQLLLEASAEEDRAVEELQAVARLLRLLDEREAIAATASELAALLAEAPEPKEPAGPAAPPDLARVLKEARLLLDGVMRAAEILQARLPEGVSKAELLERLRKAAEKFQRALEAGQGNGAEEAAGLLAEGRALLAEAQALARRIRGEAEAGLAQAAEEEGKGKEAGDKESDSPELEEVYDELARIQSERERSAEIEAEIEDLLREPSKEGMADKLKELAELEKALAEELGARFLTTRKLVELVAELLKSGKAAQEIARSERRLREELQDRAKRGLEKEGEEKGSLVRRQETQLSEAEALGKKIKGSGAILTINLPQVLKPISEAESRLKPALAALKGALSSLKSERPASAEEPLAKGALELEVLAELLAAARERALEEIAAREDQEAPGVELGSQGMEGAMESMREAARELGRGRPDAARGLQQSASRGLASIADALRARLDRVRLGEEGFVLARGAAEAARAPGARWEVLLRGDEPRPGRLEKDEKSGDGLEESSEGFPDEYRELARIYLRALAGK
jgi:hypothetical protein